MAVKQYPHYLFLRVVPESVQDAGGNWADAAGGWVFHSLCREETNGAGRQIVTADGQAIIPSSVVYMPKTAEVIAEGTEVLVSNIKSEVQGIRINKQVLKFDPRQMNNKLWL